MLKPHNIVNYNQTEIDEIYDRMPEKWVKWQKHPKKVVYRPLLIMKDK